jgi:hypothetical protein
LIDRPDLIAGLLSLAQEALAALGQAPGVALLSPPYFLHQDSPVMDQLRNVKYTLRSEYQEFCKHHDMQVRRIPIPIPSPLHNLRIVTLLWHVCHMRAFAAAVSIA